MLIRLKQSLYLLLFLAILFASPIVAVGYAAHGPELALLAIIGSLLLVVLGPLSFFIVSDLVSTVELVLIISLGIIAFLFWLRAIRLGPKSYLPYMSLTTWAMLGGYCCIALFFSHIGQ